jgi:hypothetical protein
MRLIELGERICIIGPSNSGKSTLAEAIARKRGLKAVHLDQLHHLPNTNWKPRPAADFLALHDEEISGSQWVIDGNYSKCFPQRFQRATGGGQDSLKMSMFHHLAVVTPRNRKRYADVYHRLDLPKVYLSSMRAIDACYLDWALERAPRA